MNTLLHFLLENIPSFNEILLFSPLFILAISLELFISGWLKKKFSLATGLSRKIFHFITFISVSIIQYSLGLPILCLYGASCGLVLLLVVVHKNNILYDAIAREKDIPYQTSFIIIPYLSTLLGGVTSNILFPPFAIYGYLVAGIGDAFGEIFGTLFGKHTYTPLSFLRIKKQKTYEGSLAVFLGSFFALFFTQCFVNNFSWYFLITSLCIAFVSTLIEALSPPATDNFFMQVFPSALIGYGAFL